MIGDPIDLASRLSRVQPSATLAVTTEVARLRAAGVSILDLGPGEPDFASPASARAAAIAAIGSGTIRYTPVVGTDELRAAIVGKLARVNGLLVSEPETIATCGGKHALFSALHALFDRGDEVLLLAPYWVSYADILRLAGARPRVVRTGLREGFKITPDRLARALTARTRGLILNTPCNPTGAAYDEGELRALGQVLVAHPRLWVVLDEVYERFHYDGAPPPHLLAMFPELRERTVIVNSVSKTYGMTGWRLGYAIAPERVVRAMATLQGQCTSNPSSPAQVAAAAALREVDWEPPLAEYRRRRDQTVERLRRIPGVRCTVPGGAFYVLADVSGLLDRVFAGRPLGDSTGVCRFLLDQARVAAVPGDAFAAPKTLRLSYGVKPEVLARGLDAIESAVARLESAVAR